MQEGKNSLDGLTIFRFAHMWRHASSGGIEGYLWNLNRSLLARNKMRILQMYLVRDSEPFSIEREKVGLGEIVWIPSILKTSTVGQNRIAKRILAKLRGRAALSKLVVNHDILLSELDHYRPQLGIFHWISEDSEAISNYLSNNSIPLIIINHFDNKRLYRKDIRQQISRGMVIAGVSDIEVPKFLKNQFVNLSDGIDTDFFDPQRALSLDVKIEKPLILLPSRIYEEKGHLDAVKALGILTRSKMKASLVIAGREEGKDFINKLMRLIADERVQEKVIFIGELSPEDLRNWYAVSDLILLPSYSEGLGRVLLEAQAMEKPVLAYDVGGVREAFLEGFSGFLVKKRDIRGLAKRLQDLLENKCYQNAMGQRRREFVVSQFSLGSLAIRHERFYTHVLSLNR